MANAVGGRFNMALGIDTRYAIRRGAIKQFLEGPEVRNAMASLGEEVYNEAKSRCPVATGALLSSLFYSVDGVIVTIGSDLDYAPHVEYGTYKWRGHPFIRPAIYAVAGKHAKSAPTMNSGTEV